MTNPTLAGLDRICIALRSLKSVTAEIDARYTDAKAREFIEMDGRKPSNQGRYACCIGR